MTDFEVKFKRILKDKGIMKKDIYEGLGITQPTLNARLKEPKSFRVSELETLKNKFNINLFEL